MKESENKTGHKKDFVHLHLHTDYSLLQSTIQIKQLAARLGEIGMEACAITDHGNLYGAITFYNTLKSKGLRPIIGYEAIFTFESRFEKTFSIRSGERPYYHLLLLARDLTGYQNLVYLASKAFTEGFHQKPRIDLELLAERSAGLIAISPARHGPVQHYLETGAADRAAARGGAFGEIFGAGNFYLQVQDHGLAAERELNKKVAAFARSAGTGLVAGNDVFYLTEDDARAHEVLLCIGEGKTVNDSTRTVLGSSKFYLRTAEEMWGVFGNELPEALFNTLEIAEKCDLELPKGDNLTLPEFPIPDGTGCQTTDEYFERVVYEGFAVRDANVWQPMARAGKLKYSSEDYRKRISKEVSTIREMGFPGYFLIVWEFIKYAREKQIPVGPGRGSAAGSLVAYCLEITDVDPLQYDLLFERFLNPERISMPDIDIDFCVRGRAEVINHVTQFYGRESVCQIVTFGTMASKAAIKDVGRALNMGYGDVEKVAKMIPPPVRGRNVSISQALEQVPDLARAVATDPKVKDLVDLARRLEGCARHTSVHAAGVVISPKPLHEIVPVAVSTKSELTSQFTMTDLEKVGMLKMDFLALTTLTIISDCLKSLKERKSVVIDWREVPLDDRKTMALFGDGRTEAIFQFESSGMQEICRRLKPKELEDLAALNALYRPGPLDGGMVDDFIARHRGEKKVQYIVPEMKEILQNTYGILVYQEQIMQLAQKLAGYSLGEADMMRRAMGKKKREEMAKHEEKFITGAIERGIKKEKAAEIFRLMAQFADYGFNRSHSVAYAYLAYQTAYLKAHYPEYFYAAVLSHESQDSAKVYKYSNELRIAGLSLLPPDINESDHGFTPIDGSVRYGLSAIKGIGTSSVQSIIEKRVAGRFNSIVDFAERVEQGAVNRKALESLITAGAFDSLKPEGSSINGWRARLYSGIDIIIAHGQKVWSDRLRGQDDLFGGGLQGGQKVDLDLNLPMVDDWTTAEVSRQEKASVGFFLSNHPLDDYRTVLDDLKIRNIADREDLAVGERVLMAGIISGFQVRHSKKGNRFCIFRLEDQSAGVKCLAWADTFSKHQEVLKEDEIVIVEAKVEANDGTEITLILEEARKLGDAIPQKAKNMEVFLPVRQLEGVYLDSVLTALSREQGKCEVYLNYNLEDNLNIRIFSAPLRVNGSIKLEKRLQELGCQVKWNL
ncbi:MAG: DNA polymerase III subunit alpha [Acidobacteria bacterium]|nr:DNA polymerase III subunit alpha [Acidobacteriota bacterium]